MKTQSAKAKGRRLQQWVRDKIKFVFGLEDADVSSRSMGAAGTDVLLSSDARRMFPYAVECKAQERVSLWAAWEQTVANSAAGEPVLFIKRNKKDPLVVIDAQHFFALAEAYNFYRHHGARG